MIVEDIRMPTNVIIKVATFTVIWVICNLVPTHAQTRIDSLLDGVMSMDTDGGARILQDFEDNELGGADDTIMCDFLYAKACYYEKNGNHDEAVRWYRRHAILQDSLQRYDQSFYDATLRTMLWDKSNGLADEAIGLGFTAINTPEEQQVKYKNQYPIYISLAATLNKTFRYVDVPEIAAKGQFYVRRQANPNSEEYYQLPFCEAISYSLMGDEDKADSICHWLNVQPISKMLSFAKSLKELEDDIQWFREHGIAEQKNEAWRNIERMTRNLPRYDARTKTGASMFHDYFGIVRNSLSYFYFDINSANDEMLWDRWLDNLMSSLYIYCDEMPGRACEAYDNELVRKDFLSFHTGRFRKSPTKWTDIQNRLNADEAAIEVASFQEEILIIRKDYSEPKSIEISKQLSEEIANGLKDEPLSINNTYSLQGPLSKLWNLIEPELDGIKTIYISGTNDYSQINYAAIPLSDSLIVADKYDVYSMLSTSDAGTGRHSSVSLNNAVLFGGIDYNDAEYSGKTYPHKYNDEAWNLTRGLPDDVRSGFDNLPWSKKEAISVDSIFKSKGLHDNIFMGKQATEEKFKSLDGNAPEVLHISTHGFNLANVLRMYSRVEMGSTDTQYKNFLSQSGLLFAGANKAWKDFKHGEHNDGILTSREITQLDLSRCKLAVLSACKSAMGERENLSGMPFGVAYALKLSGVKQVMSSLWSISDAATSFFMIDFYEHLSGCNDAHKALRLTQNDMRKSNEYSSPYYWAAFVLTE